LFAIGQAVFAPGTQTYATCQNIQPIVNKLKEKTQEIKNQLQIEAENIILG
jgi:hypothetical protein